MTHGRALALAATAALALTSAGLALAGDPPTSERHPAAEVAPESASPSAKQRLKNAGEAVERTAKKAAAATSKGVHKAVDATKRGLDKAGKAVEHAAAKTRAAITKDGSRNAPGNASGNRSREPPAD